MGLSSASVRVSSSYAGTAPPRSGALDVLRFAAALFVVLYSYGATAPIPLHEISPVFDRGYLAADFFLLLSGLVLARRYGEAVRTDALGPLAFLGRRLVRLWPAHLIVLALMVVLAMTAGGAVDWMEVAPQAMLVQAWGKLGGHGWNAPTWILSALVICYAGFPIVWKGLARLSHPAAVAVALVLVFAVDAFVRFRVGEGVFVLAPQFGLLRALPLFILGAAIARATEGAAMPRWLAVYSLVCGLAGFILAQAADNATVSIMAMALVLATLASMKPACGSRLATYGARLSYPLFITHILSASIWSGFMAAFGPLSGELAWASFGGAVGFALLFAVVFERFVDRPLQAAIARTLRIRRARPADVATA
jgi:peptidoglycan/LPS O-acetylase OafA/YrhL